MSELKWTDLLGRRFDSPNQAFLTRWFSQRAGAIIAAMAFWSGVGPNAITVTGLGFMLAACIPYALGMGHSAWILAAVLWQAGFAFDCADGQLARATGTAGPFGAWLDVACDHTRQSAMLMALMLVFIQTELPFVLSVIGAFVLIAGQSVYLHTASFMKVEKPSELSVHGLGAVARQSLRFLLDTPVFLLVVCLLRPWPVLLLAYCVFHGFMLLLRAIAIGVNRLHA
jgi:phosphatidylglycerophosphate synthase